MNARKKKQSEDKPYDYIDKIVYLIIIGLIFGGMISDKYLDDQVSYGKTYMVTPGVEIDGSPIRAY